MEQRTLRLGDILDDYCPRERRVTNHAVVAMIDENVKQTRCTTCEAEHAYKGAKEPRRRKKDAGVVLYEEVLAGMPDTGDASPAPALPAAPPPPVPAERVEIRDGVVQAEAGTPEPAAAPANPAADAADPADDDPRGHVDDGPFHRRLIRATLPRPEGQKEVRQVPDFTIRQNSGRDNGHNPYRSDRFKMRGPGAGGQGSGNRPSGAGRRFAGGGSPSGGPGMPGSRGDRGGSGRPGFGGGNPQRPGGPSTGSGRGPSTGSGHSPSAGAGRNGNGRKRSR